MFNHQQIHEGTLRLFSSSVGFYEIWWNINKVHWIQVWSSIQNGNVWSTAMRNAYGIHHHITYIKVCVIWVRLKLRMLLILYQMFSFQWEHDGGFPGSLFGPFPATFDDGEGYHITRKTWCLVSWKRFVIDGKRTTSNLNKNSNIFGNMCGAAK